MKEVTFSITCFPLFLVFLVLRLTEVINWSWWWVTAPLWLPIGLFIAITILFLFISLIIVIVSNSY